jgi:hypothetical protein
LSCGHSPKSMAAWSRELAERRAEPSKDARAAASEVVGNMNEGSWTDLDITNEIAEALESFAQERVREEREACAQLMEARFRKVSERPSYDKRGPGEFRSPFADAIRARGKE